MLVPMGGLDGRTRNRAKGNTDTFGEVISVSYEGRLGDFCGA
jgi:hypothetical protein